MSMEILRKLNALAERFDQLEARVGKLEKVDVVDEGHSLPAVEARYVALGEEIRELRDLKAAIVADVELIVEDMRSRGRPIDPKRAKLPQSLRKLGIKDRSQEDLDPKE